MFKSGAFFSLCLFCFMSLESAGAAGAEIKRSAAILAADNSELFRLMLLQNGGKLQGASVNDEGHEGIAVDVKRSYLLTITKGSEAKVLRAFRQELSDAITKADGKIGKTDTREIDNQLQGFTLKYLCGDNAGVINVHIEPRKKPGDYYIFLYCYEHPKP